MKKICLLALLALAFSVSAFAAPILEGSDVVDLGDGYVLYPDSAKKDLYYFTLDFLGFQRSSSGSPIAQILRVKLPSGETRGYLDSSLELSHTPGFEYAMHIFQVTHHWPAIKLLFPSTLPTLQMIDLKHGAPNDLFLDPSLPSMRPLKMDHTVEIPFHAVVTQNGLDLLKGTQESISERLLVRVCYSVTGFRRDTVGMAEPMEKQICTEMQDWDAL